MENPATEGKSEIKDIGGIQFSVPPHNFEFEKSKDIDSDLDIKFTLMKTPDRLTGNVRLMIQCEVLVGDSVLIRPFLLSYRYNDSRKIYRVFQSIGSMMQNPIFIETLQIREYRKNNKKTLPDSTSPVISEGKYLAEKLDPQSTLEFAFEEAYNGGAYYKYYADKPIIYI